MAEMPLVQVTLGGWLRHSDVAPLTEGGVVQESGGVGCDFHDEISVQSGTDPFQQRDSRHDPASFQPRQGRLRHASTGCEFDLRQA